jgi:hypothetical protein
MPFDTDRRAHWHAELLVGVAEQRGRNGEAISAKMPSD